MKLMLIFDDLGRLMMAEQVGTGLLVFRHDNESIEAFMCRVREQMGLDSDPEPF